MIEPDARFQAAFDHAPVAMAIVTRDTHRIVQANHAAGQLLGIDAAALTGRFITEFRDRDGLSTHGGHVDGTDPDEEDPGFSGERAIRRPDGHRTWVEAHSAVLPGETVDGHALCLLHLIDITPRKMADEERTRRQDWVAALAEIRLAVLLGTSTHRALALVCRRSRSLLEADDAVVVVPSPDREIGLVEAADGPDAEHLVHQAVPLRAGLAGAVMESGRVVVTASAQDGAVLDGLLPASGRGAVLAIPLRTPDVVIGVLCVVRPAGRPFTRPDVDIARSFAEQAAAALHIGELRADRERLRVLEDRERIARDLHDSVIQDLFAAGMALEAAQPLIGNRRASERVSTTIDVLDATIKKVRATIFELETNDPGERASDVLRAAVDARRDQLGFEAKLEVEGDVDDLAPPTFEHVVAVVSEALSNVARHAGAESAGVHLRIREDGAFTLEIRDDGGGFDPRRVPPGNGLANMRRRAQLVGGAFEVRSGVGRGTRLLLTTEAGEPAASTGSIPTVDTRLIGAAFAPALTIDLAGDAQAWHSLGTPGD